MEMRGRLRSKRFPDKSIAEMSYHLCLGSNIGARRKNLALAAGHLKKSGVRIVKRSSIFETEPVDFVDQPWFLNQVLEVKTGLVPYELLTLAKAIESRMRRSASVPKGPRTIDLDILLAEDTIIDTPELTIPHPGLAMRNFVLVPLAEIAPETIHPLLHETIRELARKCPDRAQVLIQKGRPRSSSGLRSR